ncbi:MAG: divergent polysaccharide deacetylase family protein [Deltaproteobacteria bacterium]|nr:divergent polysaccharide deacetylase family protein [Candidatus Tharpellaceae bacterium]
MLVVIVLLALFLWLSKNNQASPLVVENPRATVILSWENDQTFLSSIDDLTQKYVHSDSIERFTEWVSRDSRRWLLSRWEGIYQDPEEVKGLFDACQELADRNQTTYQLLSYVDSKKTSFLLILRHGYLLGSMRIHWVGPEKVRVIPQVELPRIAIIIDDMGMNTPIAKQFIQLSFPLTFSIFPYAPHSLEVAKLFHEAGQQIMLHVPMEPHGYPDVDPGPGALLDSMNDQQLLSRFRKELSAIPGIVGINNHMGSKLTENRHIMALFMNCLHDEPLFFIDSRTIAGTVAFDEALKAGIPAGQRDVFLDNIQDEQYILTQLRKLIAIAKIKKTAVGIGHPYPETVAALRRVGQLTQESRVTIVPVSKLIEKNMDR